jgi:phage tail sheath protein FI
MPEYLSPGVYVEEVDTGNKPIEGVATSTVGFLGVTERGVDDEAVLIVSFGDYSRAFGSYVQDRYLTHAVEGFFQNGGKRCFVVRVASGDPAALQASLPVGDMTVNAVGKGVWGRRIAVKVSNAGISDPTLFKLTVMYWAVLPPLPLLDPTHPESRLPANAPNRREPTLIDVYDNLSPNPNASSFYKRRVNGFSNLVELEQTGPSRPANNAAENTQPLVPGQIPFLQGGADGPAPTRADGQRSLSVLEGVDEVAILCFPDEHVPAFAGMTDDLVQQCERLMDRFAIIQASQTPNPVATHFPTTTSKYAAYYFPWLEIRNPADGTPLLIPPGGHLAGIYARSDIARGVHKAPANEKINGLYFDPNDPFRGLQRQITKGEQDILNPRGVNVMRYFPGRGNLVWGARTTSRDPDWKYVNVRRLFIYVEESIEEATQWVVFEPNDEPLWARVRRSVSDFLTRLWMDGMLQGKTKEEAYFVRCDRTTMTQADIDNGRLIILIGIAPVKPAEFVIFRIGQWTGGSEVSEG